MSEVARWFDRKFEFTFPVALHPNLCVRLRGTPVRLEETVRGLPRGMLIRRPEQGWSIQEHAGHMLDLESLWSARIDDFLAGASQLTPADLDNRKTAEADHSGRELGQILEEFREARFRLVDRAQELSGELLSRAIPHPRLQEPMRIVDHLFFVAEHDDHHLARIWDLVRRHQGRS